MASSPIARTGISLREIMVAASIFRWISSGMAGIATGNCLCLLQLLIWSTVLLVAVVSLMVHPRRVRPLSSSSGGSRDDQVKDRTYKLNEDKIGGYRTSPARTRRASSNTRHNELQEIRASDLHLDDRAINSGGWSGYVLGGILNGRRVAVKLAPPDSERAEALLNEVRAYEKLRKYWREYVPSLVGYGTTVIGQIMFIATEFIDGTPLGSGTVTEEVSIAARQSLGAVHACKLLHGDVEARNIMVVQGTQPSVRLIDFGFAQRSNNWRSQLTELKKLDSVMEDTMGVWVGKSLVHDSLLTEPDFA